MYLSTFNRVVFQYNHNDEMGKGENCYHRRTTGINTKLAMSGSIKLHIQEKGNLRQESVSTQLQKITAPIQIMVWF